MSRLESQVNSIAALKWRDTEPTRLSERFLTFVHTPNGSIQRVVEGTRKVGSQAYDEVAVTCIEVGLRRRDGFLIGFGVSLKLVRILLA